MDRKPKPGWKWWRPPTTTKDSRWGFRGKTVWDFLDLLLAPLLVGVIAVALTAWFNNQQDARQQQIENQRAKGEQELAEQRAQDEALQSYLDQMSQLLLEKNLRDAEVDSEVRTLARARTLTVLRRFDDTRKGRVIQFLYESGLISAEDGPIVSLRGTDMSGVNLSYAALMGADLRETDLSHADLSSANLSNANLSGDINLNEPHPPSAYLGEDVNLTDADLSSAYLRGANLSDAELIRADLSDADLIRTDLGSASLNDANLRSASLQEANLRGAYLIGANLKEAELRLAELGLGGADLTYADLTDAQVTQKQLAAAKSLEGATMPDGQTLKSADNPDWPTFEEWLKSRGRDG